jgi:hypothetical protein
MTGHTHGAAQMNPNTPTTRRPERARLAPLPLVRRRAGRQQQTRGEPGEGARALRDKAPEGGDNAKEDRTPKAPAKAAVG